MHDAEKKSETETKPEWPMVKGGATQHPYNRLIKSERGTLREKNI